MAAARLPACPPACLPVCDQQHVTVNSTTVQDLQVVRTAWPENVGSWFLGT
jgi:hypothetical protein